MVQVLVPQPFRVPLLQLAHSNPLGSHLGKEKIEVHLVRKFCWPHLYEEIEQFCGRCLEYQKVNQKKHPEVPL